MKMEIDVFWLSGSPYSWRALLALQIKQTSYVDRRLDASKGDLKSPEYLAINPRGRAPALRDGDFVLNDSVAIMAYSAPVAQSRSARPARSPVRSGASFASARTILRMKW